VSFEQRDPRFAGLLAPGVQCETIAQGFMFTEGPVWRGGDQSLLFTDIPASRIHRWSAGAGVSIYREPSHMANGLAIDRQGRLVACEHATSRLTRTEPDGRVVVLASHYGEKELNSPNDVVVKSDGSIYFTDPSYGRNPYYGVEREPALGFKGVYRVDATGKLLTLLADDFLQPNGLCFAADESRLYVNDTERGYIRRFDVKPDGTLAGGQVWAQLTGEGQGAPDGMKIDSQGHLFCTGPGGIHVFDHEARCLGVIHVPEGAANFTWGDADLCSLFITATNGLYRIRVKVPGRAG
jgi:gluconolactonase